MLVNEELEELTKQSVGLSRLRKAAMHRPSGSKVGKSLAECTARSTLPLSNDSSSS